MKIDYSKTVLAKGIICYNTNNQKKCIVLDGNKGKEHDRCSLVLEPMFGSLVMHTPPNRALIPTGEYVDIAAIENLLNSKPVMEENNE